MRNNGDSTPVLRLSDQAAATQQRPSDSGRFSRCSPSTAKCLFRAAFKPEQRLKRLKPDIYNAHAHTVPAAVYIGQESLRSLLPHMKLSDLHFFPSQASATEAPPGSLASSIAVWIQQATQATESQTCKPATTSRPWFALPVPEIWVTRSHALLPKRCA